MINYIFYTHLYNKDSGGIVVPYLICHEINKIYPNKAYIAPIFCNGNDLKNLLHFFYGNTHHL